MTEATGQPMGDRRPGRVLASRNGYPFLDRVDVHNARAAVRHYLATVQTCPPSMRQTFARLSDALTASPMGSESHCATSQLAVEGLLSTNDAATALGCTPRAVRYRAEQLGAVRIGRYLAYPADVVHRLARQKGDTDA